MKALTNKVIYSRKDSIREIINGWNILIHEPVVQKFEIDLIEYLKSDNLSEIIHSLEFVHDLALYQTDCSINEEEKLALFHVKALQKKIIAFQQKQLSK